MIRIAQLETVTSPSGIVYRPRVYGDANAAVWDGYIVFFPLTVATVISTPRETTKRTLEDLEQWALTLDRVYLEGALVRALETASGVPVPGSSIAEGEAAELSAAADAIAAADALVRDDVRANRRAAEVTAAEAELSHTRAHAHETLAKAERLEAQELDRQARAYGEDAAAAVASHAETVADVHEEKARQARAVAADVEKRAGAGGRKKSGRTAAKSGRRTRR